MPGARRRFLRILPPYWLALTVLAIFPGLAGVFTDQWWVFYGLLQLFPIYDTTQCAQTALGCGIATAATLPGELGVYVMLPFYALLIAALAKRRIGERWLRTEILLLLALSVVSLGVRAWAAIQVPQEPFLFYGVTGTFWWLAVGMGMAAISVALQGREDENRIVALIAKYPWVCWLGRAAIFVGLAIAYPTPTLFHIRPDPVEVVVEFVALGVGAGLFFLPAVFGARAGGLPRRVLANPVLGWLGVISYGLYLYHLPIQDKLREAGLLDVFPDSAAMLPAISLPLAILGAAASYYFSSGRSCTSRSPAPGAAGGAGPRLRGRSRPSVPCRPPRRRRRPWSPRSANDSPHRRCRCGARTGPWTRPRG